jgi:hypothetical protein
MYKSYILSQRKTLDIALKNKNFFPSLVLLGFIFILMYIQIMYIFNPLYFR